MHFLFSHRNNDYANTPYVILYAHCLSYLIKEMEVFGNQSHEVAERKISAHAGDRTPVAELASICVRDV